MRRGDSSRLVFCRLTYTANLFGLCRKTKMDHRRTSSELRSSLLLVRNLRFRSVMAEGQSIRFFLQGAIFSLRPATKKQKGPQQKKRASDRHRRPVLTSETTKRKSSNIFSLLADSAISFPVRRYPGTRYYATIPYYRYGSRYLGKRLHSKACHKTKCLQVVGSDLRKTSGLRIPDGIGLLQKG